MDTVHNSLGDSYGCAEKGDDGSHTDERGWRIGWGSHCRSTGSAGGQSLNAMIFLPMSVSSSDFSVSSSYANTDVGDDDGVEDTASVWTANAGLVAHAQLITRSA